MDKFNDSYTELLISIFDLVHEQSDIRAPIYTPLTLSHVCRRWHEVVLDLPRCWTRVHLSHFHLVSVTEGILRRSAPLPLFLSIDCTKSAHSSWDPDSDGSKAFITTVTESTVISRLRDLRLSAPYPILSAITIRAFTFPSLENLVIRQVESSKEDGYLGPLSFNPEVFRSLALEGVGMRLSNPSDISGIQFLSLVKAPGNLLDQTKLLDPRNPSRELEPSMTALRELRLTNTSPRPRSISTNLPPTPSFEGTKLKYLYLAEYDFGVPDGVLRIALNPMVLEELELNRFRLAAIARVLIVIHSNVHGRVTMPFVKLHTLTIRGIPTLPRELLSCLLRSFPQLRLLRLLETEVADVDEFEAVLRNTRLCPFLASFWANGVEYPRRSAAMIVPP